MTVNRITVGDNSFSYNVLLAKHSKYLPLMSTQLTRTQFTQKESESFDAYLLRIFNLIYRRQNPVARGTNTTQRRSITIDEKATAMLNALGITFVKKCPIKSKIMFKNSGRSYRMNNEEMLKLISCTKSSLNYKKVKKLPVKIGVEFEFIGKYAKQNQFIKKMKELVGADNFSSPLSYNHNDGGKWVLGKDGSVAPMSSDSGLGMSGYELTTPILNVNSKSDMAMLKKVCELIQIEFEGHTNKKCGTHIHMSFPVNKDDLEWNYGCMAENEFLKHFCRSYRKSEPTLFDRLVPKDRRENKAKYAKTASIRYLLDRYRKLNFGNVKRGSDNLHLEFRQLNGTLDYDTVYSWVKIQKMFCEFTMHTWNNSQAQDNESKAIQLNLEDVIGTKIFNETISETLLIMGGLAA